MDTSSNMHLDKYMQEDSNDTEEFNKIMYELIGSSYQPSNIIFPKYCQIDMPFVVNHKDSDLLGPKLSSSSTVEDFKTSNPCSCQKTKCLKMYCSCISRGGYCGPECGCVDCWNDGSHEVEREGAIRTAQLYMQCPRRKEDRKLGCRCKRNKCKQKYCECYAKGEGCSSTCQCKGCRNKPQNKKVKI